MKIVNYLDVTFNLDDGTYQPCQKTENMIQYIHVESNYPPNTIRQIPKIIKKRFSQLSPNEAIFNASVLLYEVKIYQFDYQSTKTHSKHKQKRNKFDLTPLSTEMYPQKLTNIF